MDNKKELIILAFYFDVENMPRSEAHKHMQEYIKIVEESFNDVELKEHYIIKQFFFPTNYTKLECIYPTSKNISSNIELEHQLKKVETEILKHKDPKLWDEWNILMRWAKLKNLNDINESS